MEKDIRVPALYNQLWGNSQSPHLYYTSYVVLHYTSNFFLNWVKKYFDEIWVYLCLCNYMNIHVSVWSFKSLILFNKEVNLNVIGFYIMPIFVQACCCSLAQLCLTLWNPMDCSTPGFPVHHRLWELGQTHVHQVGDAIQPSPSSSPPGFNLSQHQGPL